MYIGPWQEFQLAQRTGRGGRAAAPSAAVLDNVRKLLEDAASSGDFQGDAVTKLEAMLAAVQEKDRSSSGRPGSAASSRASLGQHGQHTARSSNYSHASSRQPGSGLPYGGGYNNRQPYLHPAAGITGSYSQQHHQRRPGSNASSARSDTSSHHWAAPTAAALAALNYDHVVRPPRDTIINGVRHRQRNSSTHSSSGQGATMHMSVSRGSRRSRASAPEAHGSHNAMGATMGTGGGAIAGRESGTLPRAGSAHEFEGTHNSSHSRRSSALPNAASSAPPFQQPPSIGQPPVSMNTNYGTTGATAPAAGAASAMGSGYDGKAAAALLRAERQSKALKTGRADLGKFFTGDAWDELRALERQKRALMDQDVEGKDKGDHGGGTTGSGGVGSGGGDGTGSGVPKKKGSGSSHVNRIAEVRSMKEVYLEALRSDTHNSTAAAAAAVDASGAGLGLSPREDPSATQNTSLISEEETASLSNRGRRQRPEPMVEHSAATAVATDNASPRHGNQTKVAIPTAAAPAAPAAAAGAGPVANLTLQPEHLSLVAKYFGGDEALRDLEASVLHTNMAEADRPPRESQPLRSTTELPPHQPSPLNASPIRTRPLPPEPSAASAPQPQPTLTLHSSSGTLRGTEEGGSFIPGRIHTSGRLTPGRLTPGRQTPGRQTPGRTPLRTPSGGGPGGGSVDALLDWANTLDFDFDDL